MIHTGFLVSNWKSLGSIGFSRWWKYFFFFFTIHVVSHGVLKLGGIHYTHKGRNWGWSYSLWNTHCLARCLACSRCKVNAEDKIPPGHSVESSQPIWVYIHTNTHTILNQASASWSPMTPTLPSLLQDSFPSSRTTCLSTYQMFPLGWPIMIYLNCNMLKNGL